MLQINAFRFRFTFGLRTLLLLIGCLAVFWSTLGKQAHDQQAAADLFRLRGYGIGYDTRERHAFLSGTASVYEEPWLARYFGYDMFYDVVSMGCDDYPTTTDCDLANLHFFPKLKNLTLGGSGITDAGLIHLRKLTHLEHVTFWNTQITEDGVTQLRAYLPDSEIA